MARFHSPRSSSRGTSPRDDESVSAYSDSDSTATSGFRVFSRAPIKSNASVSTASSAPTALDDDEVDNINNRIYFCEFVGLDSCDERYRIDQFDEWVNHIVATHLQHRYPKRTWCWFCDTHAEFSTESNAFSDRARCFRQRMMHISQHIIDGSTVRHMRPDFPLVDHLLKENLVDQAVRDYARSFHEAPQPRGAFMSPQRPTRPPPERASLIQSSGFRRGRRRIRPEQMYHV